jgi:hypothetical protein
MKNNEKRIQAAPWFWKSHTCLGLRSKKQVSSPTSRSNPFQAVFLLFLPHFSIICVWWGLCKAFYIIIVVIVFILVEQLGRLPTQIIEKCGRKRRKTAWKGLLREVGEETCFLLLKPRHVWLFQNHGAACIRFSLFFISGQKKEFGEIWPWSYVDLSWLLE